MTTEKEKVRRNSVREGRGGGKSAACMGRAMRSAGRHLCNHGRSKSASIPWTALRQLLYTRAQFQLISSSAFQPCCLSVGEKVNEWKTEVKKTVMLRASCRTVGEKVKEKWGTERCRQDRKRNLNGPILPLKPHRVHLRAGLLPVCVSMERGLLSVPFCTNWK